MKILKTYENFNDENIKNIGNIAITIKNSKFNPSIILYEHHEKKHYMLAMLAKNINNHITPRLVPKILIKDIRTPKEYYQLYPNNQLLNLLFLIQTYLNNNNEPLLKYAFDKILNDIPELKIKLKTKKFKL